MGSTKDIKILKPVELRKMGWGLFGFSDRYSVFDWGEMPDHIKNKGAALCMMSAYFFEELKKMGIESSYAGLKIGDDEKRYFVNKQFLNPSNEMWVKFVMKPELPARRVKEITEMDKKEYIGIAPIKNDEKIEEYVLYDYSVYQQSPRNILIPLEVMYRNTLPKGSSVFDRLNKGTLTYQDLGLDHMPVEGEKLPQPYFDVSTKIEDGDRYMKWNEAQRLSGLDNEELERIKALLNKGNKLITETMAPLGINNDDGKFEFGISPYRTYRREFMFVDVLGTPDECRFTMDGVQMSKEVARQWYRNNQPEWVKEVEEKKGAEGWKGKMVNKPKHLPAEFLAIISDIYTSMANAVIGRNIFDAPPIDKVRKSLEAYVR